MKTLGIDTTTRSGSVAVAEGGRLLGMLAVSGALDHSEQLLPSLEVLLARLRIQPRSLGGIGVTRGPGSFTGVRVGLATAGGLARAWGIPALGLSALEALAVLAAADAARGWICPWIDAGRGEVYAAAYRAGGEGRPVRVRPEVLVRPEDWLPDLPACEARFLGDGARAHRELLTERRGPGALAGSGPWFLAGVAARLAARRLGAGRGVAAGVLEPLYLRPPDAERGRARRR